MKSSGKMKMQNVNFKNIDEFLHFLPEEEIIIVELLRKIIFECLPECEERLAYNVPFYRRHYNLFFIWPPSVKWGNSKQVGIRFGFTNGYLLTDEIEYLEKGKRKQVYWKDFTNVNEINIELLKSYIFEAAMIDENKAKMKKG